MSEFEIHEAARHHPSEFALGAHHDGELIGILVCDTSSTPTASMTIVVVPEWRGRGVGRALLEHMVERAPDLGLVFLTMTFHATNDAAAKLVEGHDLLVAKRSVHGVVKVALAVQSDVSVVADAA
jgi:ribosomal protein S18 acetylase RimI-like enzyme